MRGLSYKRRQRERHIKRKENILRSYVPDGRPHKYDTFPYFSFVKNTIHKPIELNEGNWTPYWWVSDRGYLNKGKIHCSCPMCTSKTKNKGSRRHKKGSWGPTYNYKHSDLQKINKMDYQLFDYFQNF